MDDEQLARYLEAIQVDLNAIRTEMVTRQDLALELSMIRSEMATKQAVEQLATQNDVEHRAIRKDIAQLSTEFRSFRVGLSDG